MAKDPDFLKRHATTLCLLLTAAAASVVMAPALKAGFVNWDDPVYLHGNRMIHSLDPHSLKTLFTSLFEGNYHPVTLLSFSLEYALFGLNPFPYHLSNYLLHILNALLVFFLTRGLFQSRATALFCSLIFAVHPLRVEAVAWISERKEVLSTSFYLGALLAYTRWARRGSGRSFPAVSFALFLLAVLSKPMAVTLPLALFLVDWYLAMPLSRRTLLLKVPYLVAGAAAAAVTFLAQHGAGAITIQAGGYGWRYPITVFHNLWFYVSRFALPLRLSAFYPYPQEAQIVSPGYLAGAALGAGFLLSLSPLTRGLREYRLGAWFFLLTILPVLGIVPVGSTPVADRYFYLTGIGLAWAAAGLLRASKAAFPSTNPRARAAGLAALSLWLAALGILTWSRSMVWRDSVSLWSDAAGKYPGEFKVQFNLGKGYLEKGDPSSALPHFTSAISLKPFLELGGRRVRDPYLHYYRGVALAGTGRREDAESEFAAAVEARPDYVPALMELAILQAGREEYDLALRTLNRALTHGPGNPLLFVNLGVVYERKGEFEKARNAYLRARQLGYGGNLEERIRRLRR